MADDSCRGCHPAQTAAFGASPMGRSLSAADGGGSGQFRHELSGSQFWIQGRRQSVTRNGISATYEADYRIGSGSHARGFLMRIGRDLFQSPVAEYPRDKRWNLAPGYETMTHPDFNRLVSQECLLCHGDGNVGEPSAIGCARCHGPPEQHLHNPGKGSIINPARLPEAERDAVCEQCHLAGEARIPNPGRTFAGFRPGQAMEDTFSVYVFDRPRADLRVISHVEQLARSRCAPKLSCGTCHSPHGDAIPVNSRCQGCHSGARVAGHPKGAECTACHMPKRATSDGAHTAFTDHRITRRPLTSQPRGIAGIKAWREPPSPSLRARNLGLAMISVGERDRVPTLIQEGYRQLRSVITRYERDADVLASLGMVLFLKDQFKDAVQLMEAAIAQRPDDASLHEKLAVLRRAAGDKERAAAAAEKAIALDPARESAYHLLHEIRPESGALQRYLQYNPRSVIAHEAIGRLRR